MKKEIRDKILEDYQTGTFTRAELAVVYGYSKRTIDRILYNQHKPFRYVSHMSLERLKERGIEIPAKPLTNSSEYVKIVRCPEVGCTFTGRANSLLTHLIRKHGRHDLEYLLD